MPEQSETGGSIKDHVEKIVGNLGAILGQRVQSDDDLIMGRVEDAYAHAVCILRDLAREEFIVHRVRSKVLTILNSADEI